MHTGEIVNIVVELLLGGLIGWAFAFLFSNVLVRGGMGLLLAALIVITALSELLAGSCTSADRLNESLFEFSRSNGVISLGFVIGLIATLYLKWRSPQPPRRER